MILHRIIKPIFITLCKLLPDKSHINIKLNDIKRIIIIWSENDLSSLFFLLPVLDSIKDKYPNSEIKIAVSPRVVKNKKFFLLKNYFNSVTTEEIVSYSTLEVLSQKYDLLFHPILRKISFRTHILSFFIKAKYKIGIGQFDNIVNPFKSIFNKTKTISIKKHPDIHYSEFLFFQFSDLELGKFRYNLQLQKSVNKNEDYIVIFNNPEKKYCRWNSDKILYLANRLAEEYKCSIIIFDNTIISEDQNKFLKFIKTNLFEDTIDIIVRSKLIISVNAFALHIAGRYNIPQISLFASDNGFNCSPIGKNKIFIQSKSSLMNDIALEDVYNATKKLLDNNGKEE